jgi:hypothetical protein
MVSHNQQKSANPWIGRAIKMKVFLIFSAQKKIREQKFESAPFSFGKETYGDLTIRERAF